METSGSETGKKQTPLGSKAALLLLLALCAAFSLFKIRLFTLSPGFDRTDDTAFFWSESAFQYRYARMAAEGLEIPSADTAAQFPEGARPRKDFTLLMEPLYGGIYRALFGDGGYPFHLFLIIIISLYTSLSLAAAYSLGKELSESPSGGVTAAALYAAARISWARTVNGFNYEDFALPLIFGGLAFFVKAMKADGRARAGYSVVAALLTAAALAGWHFSRFYLLVFAAAAAAALLPRRDGEKALLPLTAMLGASVIAALSVPVLRASGFLLSPPVLALGALTAALALRKKSGLTPARTILSFFIALVILGAAAAFLPGGDAREYSHVYSLFMNKAANLLSKPADPALIPFEVRVLWVEALDTPSPAEWLTYLSILVPLGLPAFLLGARGLKARPDAYRALLFSLTLSFLLLSLFAVRMFLFSAFFLALYTSAYPRLLGNLAGRRGRRAAWGAAAAALALSVVFDFAGFLMRKPPASPPTFYREDVKTLVEWARADTGTDDVFLGNLGASAALLAYAGRPTVINPKFETRRLRDKFERFALTIFKSERELHALCLEYGADYFVHENHFVLDRSDKSFRYLADKLRLPAGSAAHLMQFSPDRLKFFTPAHQTSTFRVYRVLRPGIRPPPARELPYDPIYDPRVFGVSPGAEFFDDGPVMRAATRILLDRRGG